MTLRQTLRLVAPETWKDYQNEGSDDALDALCTALTTAMSTGSLVATGRRADDPERETVIELSAWKLDVQPVIWCDELSIRGVRLFGVRFYQAVAMPDFASRLRRSNTLEAAFRLFIDGTPLLHAVSAQIDGLSIIGPSETITFDTGDMLTGRFPSECGAWPMTVAPADLVTAWNVGGRRNLDELKRYASTKDDFDAVQHCAAAVCALIGQFLKPLQGGLIKAIGHHVETGRIEPILPAVWSSAGAALDHRGRVGTIEDGKFRPIWEMVSFQPAALVPSRIRTQPREAGEAFDPERGERTLIKAFQSDVLDDPEFVQAIDAAAGLQDTFGMPSLAFLMRRGDFPSRSGQWPVSLTAEELLDAWFGPDAWPLMVERTHGEADLLMVQREADETTLDHGWPLACQVVTVFQRFLEPLRSGEVQAWGEARAGKRMKISPATWQRRATVIDVQQGEIGRCEAESEAIEREWTAVSFASSDNSAVEPKRNKGGRPSTYDWDRAMFHLVKWIEHHGLPDDKPAATSLVIQIIKKLENQSPDRRQVEQELAKRLPAVNRFLLDRGKTQFPAFLLTLRPKKI